ncbi:MAG: thymidylate synthase [Nanobdellota archaeon]
MNFHVQDMMEWPIEFSDQLIVNDKASNVAVITLWSKKEAFKDSIDDYAVLGQLYSVDEGINSLLRNLLANKNIRYLVIAGKDLSGSGDILLKFFNEGVDEEKRIGNIRLDNEIPVSTIDELRNNIEVFDYRNCSAEDINSLISSLPEKGSYGDTEIFPKKKVEPPKTFPSENAGFLVRGDYINDVWLKILEHVMDFGTVKASDYSEDQKELISLKAVIEKEDPENPLMAHSFEFTEEDLENYYPQVLTAKSIDGIEYTYGQRLRSNKGIDQISELTEKLRKSTYTRRAVAFTWDVEKDHDNEQCPCLNMINVLVQDEKLYLTAYFRSNDMYSAWPRNAFALRKLQGKIASDLGINLGSLIMISNSAHIYKSSWKKVKAIRESFSPKKAGFDKRGNIIIRTEEGKIKLIRQSPEGERLQEFTANNAKEANRQIIENNMVSDPSHALYLGRELRKAEEALRKGLDFVQDQD